MFILLFVLLLCIISNVFCYGSNYSIKSSWDYCTHPDCSLKNQHTLCIGSGKHSPRLFVSGMTNWMRYQILLLHNRYRDNVAIGLEAGQPSATNMRKMYWDYELERMAEVWARQCQKRHDECRNTIRFNVLQNMDVRAIVSRLTEAQLLVDAVAAWFSGSRVLLAENVWSFRHGNCSIPGGCNAHWYSAAAWASTWRLGCSQALCTLKQPRSSSCPARTTFYDANPTRSTENNLKRTRFSTASYFSNISYNHTYLNRKERNSKSREKALLRLPKMIAYTFCNYGPAGNIEGFPIYEAGPPCSNCPRGTKCNDKTHRALCAVNGDPHVIH